MPLPLFPNKVANPFYQLDLHGGLFYVLFSPIPPAPAEAVLHLGFGKLSWPVNSNSVLGEDKSNQTEHKTVLADGSAVVSRCHEPKHCIVPHINVFPPPFSIFLGMINLYVPVLCFTSANKLEFAAGSVVAPSGPLAVSWYIGLSLTCNDGMSLPTGFPINWGSVLCGFTLGDFFAGVGCILFDMAKSRVEDKLFSFMAGGMPKCFPNLLKGQTSSVLRKIFPKLPVGPYSLLATRETLEIGENIVDNSLPGVLGALYSRVVGGDYGDAFWGVLGKGAEAILRPAAPVIDAVYPHLANAYWGVLGKQAELMLGPAAPYLFKSLDTLVERYADSPEDFLWKLVTGDLVSGYDGEKHQHGMAGDFGEWLDSQAEKLFSGSESVP